MGRKLQHSDRIGRPSLRNHYNQLAFHQALSMRSMLSIGSRPISPDRLGAALLIPVLLGGSCSVAAAQVGPNQGVNFGQALINNSCTLTTSDGSIGVRTNRGLITSDSAEGGSFNGTLAAATISASSNLTSTGFVRVDNPTLTGTTAATSSQVKVGGGTTWASSAQANLGADGTLGATPLHVRFSTTANNNRFANGTYTASATVSCFDGL